MGLLNGLRALTKKKTTSKKVKKKTTKKAVKKSKKKPKVVKKVKSKLRKTKKTMKKKPKKKAVKRKVIKKKLVKKKPKKAPKKKIVRKKVKKIKKKKIILEPKKMSHSHAMKLIERKDATEFVKNIAGEEGLKVFSYLIKVGKEIDEFTLADRVDLQINFVRSLLYKLYEHKLVSFSRERDKRKGWFIYSWVAHPDRLKELLIRIKNEEIVKLKKQAMDAQQLFYCKTCKKSYSYIKAMKSMFFCPICGSQLVAMESNEIKKRINEQIEKVQKEKEELESL